MMLQLIQNKPVFQKDIAKYLNLKRTKVSNLIHKMIDYGIIYDLHPRSNNWKQYKVTRKGLSILEGFESSEKQNRFFGVEQMSFFTKIKNPRNIRKFLVEPQYDFKPNPMTNWMQWVGKVEGITIKINEGKELKMQIYAPQIYKDKPFQQIWLAYDSVLQTHRNINSKWNFDLSPLEEPKRKTVEFTMKTPFAEKSMEFLDGKQVKLPSYKINKSPPSMIAHEEFSNASDFQKHLELPDKLEEFKEMTNNRFQRLEDVVKNGFDRVATVIEKQSEMIEKILTKSEPEKVEPKSLNSDAEKMFG